MKILRFNEGIEAKFSDLGDLSFAHTEFKVDSNGREYMQIEKKDGGKNFLTIIPIGSGL
jgi:hypothetical protein